jgi:transcriptional regulator GlxA family with amidase domain
MAGRRAKAIERLRLEASRERIESGSEPIERVAVRTGFGDPERMRRAFIRAFGQRRRPCGGRDQFCSRGSLSFRENHPLSQQ